jgi:hypothetical protein
MGSIDQNYLYWYMHTVSPVISSLQHVALKMSPVDSHERLVSEIKAFRGRVLFVLGSQQEIWRRDEQLEMLGKMHFMERIYECARQLLYILKEGN